MDPTNAIETLVNQSSVEKTWTINDIHLLSSPYYSEDLLCGEFVGEWVGEWTEPAPYIFEAGTGPLHSRWKLSVDKRKYYIDEWNTEIGLALGVHFLGFVQSENGARASDQKVKCLVQATISGLNSTTNEQDNVGEKIKKHHEFSVSEPDMYEGFIDWETFGSKQDEIFADNAIKIKITLTLIGDSVTKPVLDFGKLSQQETQTMENDYGKFYDNQHLSDFTIILSQESAEPIPFFAHKLVLEARSPVFQRMLQTPMREAQENKLIIKDMDLQTLTLMLQFIYKGAIEIPEDKIFIFGLLNAAKKYDLKGLSKLVLFKLQSLLNDENVEDWTVVAYENKTDHDEVISILRDYCQRYQNTLWKNPKYKEFLLQ